MTVFHGTVTRRDFMKGLGLTGATLGAAGMVSPVFHDLDEVLASPSTNWKRSWWIKELEHDKPTVELDWDMLKPLDHMADRRNQNGDRYTTAAARTAASDKGTERKKELGWDNYTIPGRQLRDSALNAAAGFRWWNLKDYTKFPPVGSNHPLSGFYAGPKSVLTPEARGTPRWTGTPEEATLMMRAAMRFFGAADVYPAELTGKHKKLINASDRYKPIVFEDVDDGYETSAKYTLPANKELYEIGYSIPESRECHRTGDTELRGAANGSRYRLNGQTLASTQNFLYGLGYIADGGTAYPITSGNGVACLHGAAEQARASWWSIDAERDPITGRYEVLTDLELAPTPPVDAGIFRFCHTCGHCANVCPSGSVSKEKEPSWEKPRSEYTGNPVAGQTWKKIFWNNHPKCEIFRSEVGTGCNICRASCVFMSSNAAMVHDITRATLSTTSLFNGFFADMFAVFDYGQKNEQGELVGLTWENYVVKAERGESWWDMSLPQFGFDTTLMSHDHGYRK